MTKEIRNSRMMRKLPARSFHYSGFAIPSSFAYHAGVGRRRVIRISSFLLLLAGFAAPAQAQSITRAEALRIGESFIQHRWQSSPKNLLHGKDRKGVEVHTPDHEGGRGSPLDECWRVNDENVGVAYKWGGDDTPATFDLGIRSGKAA